MQANPICSGATQTPAPSSRQCCSSPRPGVTGSAKGTCWCPIPALDSSLAPDLQIPVLPWAPLPSCAWPSFLTLSQNSPLCSRPEPRTAQPQNKPTSDHPSNREVACWSSGTGGVAEQSLGECSHIPQLSTGSPWGWTCSSQGWGLHYRQDPPPPCPKSEAMETPPAPLPGSWCSGWSEGQHPHCGSAGGSSLFYPGCNGAGLVQAEEDPLQQREPARFAFPSTCCCWSPFKGHATLACPPWAGDTQTRGRGRGRTCLLLQHSTAGRAGTGHSGTPKPSHWGGLGELDRVRVTKALQGAHK